MDQSSPASAKTLCLDIGGSHLKAAIIAGNGTMTGDEIRIETPVISGPPAMVEKIAEFIGPLGLFDRASVGFPGSVRQGVVQTAPNISGDGWFEFPLQQALRERFGKPLRLANDATVQGLGVIEGHGVECAITFGTGLGFALFDSGIPGPNLEFSLHPARHKKTYNDYIGNAELERVGRKRWNKRVRRVIEQFRTLVHYDMLYVGGGNARVIDFALPPHVRIVSNISGITGGIKLWNPLLDLLFAA